ncbi:MAG: phosphoglycerate dehydrogenase [Bradyrhizobium sp.]|uniref:phosphoglycerate dehydrogenase n=1 Tax=Bradyrhizobium sp. TaxID=376 RepID=UPI0027322403|nr:phosphoglycerate dehydrogenase [Bradyrhizobium sp.]MDP1868768.1 phosphoglycerate dehydrogenase [Bradyrhizobium sp.]
MPSDLLPFEQRFNTLLLEGVNDSAVELFANSKSLNIERMPKALEGDALREAIKGIDLLGIRSRTQLTGDILSSVGQLIAVGCFSVGTNQVDLDAARRRGIPVFNAPFSNTRSVAELVIGEIVMLLRRIVPRSAAAHDGGWDKSATDSHEVRGRTLGIVGYGNIGSQLSMLAEAMGMKVIFFDHTDKLRHGNTEPVESLQELLTRSDIVSLHVPETPATSGMIGEAELRLMKRGACLINNSRGTVVDLEALATALRDGHLAGAALDVFPVEPSSNSERFECPLQGLQNVILTPHIGGSTEQAQDRIGKEVARKMLDYLDTGSTMGAVNFPQVQLQKRPLGVRFSQVHRNVPGMLRRLNEVFLQRDINIFAQYLETDSEVGYVVLDADLAGHESHEILDDIRALDGTIRARLVYQH